MADSPVEFLLCNLKHLLLYNVDLISNIKEHVISLCNDLRLLAAFIKDTTQSQSHNPLVNALVKQIRIEIYKAEHIVDMYVYDASVLKSRSRFERALHIKDFHIELERVTKEIKGIRSRVKEIYRRYLFKKGDFRKDESYSLLVERDNVFGIDKEAETLVGLLKSETEGLEVISVVGMGGLGKTTLVKKVYNDSSIQHEFSVRSWVRVSQDYSAKQVFLTILYDVTREFKDMSRCSIDAIADELQKQLKYGKYLVVLDDVWTVKACDDLKRVFPDTKNGSRIMLTSRNNDVALHAQKNVPPYQLRFLTDYESWALLEKEVFPPGTRCPIELESIGKQIAKKCYGLPLALVVIGGILRMNDKTRSQWEDVKEKVNAYVAMQPEECMDVLALSYKHLPYNLKACFLYFGVFPVDFEIPVWKLIHIWVAEGFIQQIGVASAEEIAEENLHDLVDRNLVLVEKRTATGGIKTCRVHDMLHNLCVKLAQEENFFKEIKGFEPSSYVFVDPIAYRRVSIHSRVSDYISSKANSSYIRSFLCYGKDETELQPDLITFMRSFKLLRVLDVCPVSFPRFPSIQLVHLRYIALVGTFKVLPAAISKLRNLQTLIVETNYREIEVHADLWKLVHLRHFYTSAASDLPTPSSSKLRKGVIPLVNGNLRTMSKVTPNSCTDVILARTPNLQKLGIRGILTSLMEDKKGGCKFDNITKLSNLKKLKLLNDTFPIPLLESKLPGLPEWRKFPPELKKLTLSNTMLDWEHMSVLGKLQGLEVLKLLDNAFVGERWETEDGCFGQLRVLQVGKTDLVHWEAAGCHFPRLRRVSMKHCESLAALPSGLGDMPMLEVVELSWTTRPAVASARVMQKNFMLLVFPPDHETQT